VRLILSHMRVRLAVVLLMLPTVLGGHVAVGLAATTTACTASNISGGATWSAAISNGQLFTWGRNVDGELGLGFQSTQVSIPTAVKSNPLLTNVSGVWAGYITAYAVDPAGQLWAWGADENSQRGNGDPVNAVFTSTPAPVSGPTNIVSLGAAFDHVVVATPDGTVWGWGQSSGLGVGDTFFNQDSPVTLTAPAHVVRVAAGFRYSLLLTSSGTVYGAGSNTFSTLGLPGVQFVPTFQAIPGLSGVVDVSTSPNPGITFTLALDGTGHVFAFGSNNYGQMANGTAGPINTQEPTQISGLDSVIQVSAGGLHALALKSDGTVWAWGYAANGQLGIGSVSNLSVPYVPVPTQVVFPPGTQITRVAAGLLHSMAVDSTGNIWVWGDDSLGALGTGVVGQSQFTPVKISLAASCPGLPPPPTVPSVTSLSPSFGPAEGGTHVTITGTGFTGATDVQFGVNQALLQPCASTSTLFCFTVVDDAHITVLAPPHPPGNVDVFVDNVAGFSATVPGDVYSYEGWVSPTPSDRTAFDVPVGQSASFTLKALEQGPMTIGHTALPAFMQCSDTTNPGQPAQVDCTVAPTGVAVQPVTFFDAANPTRITARTYIVGRGWYSALGDSFSAGDGNEPYMNAFGFDTTADGCHRSAAAYPVTIATQLYGGQTARFVACSGAVIRDVVVGKGKVPPGMEPSQLNALDNTVDLVTISIGGNDIGFSSIATSCVLFGIICTFTDNTDAVNAIARIGKENDSGQILDPSTAPGSSSDPVYTLDNIYATIRHDAPNARILVVGYPDLLPINAPCLTAGLGTDVVNWLNGVEKSLNDTIKTEAERNGAEYVDLSTAFAGHELCSFQPYVNLLVNPPFFETPVHPNEHGQGAMARAVKAKIDAGQPGSQFLVGFDQTITTSVNVATGMSQATFSTAWPGSDVVMTLVSPSGRTITRGVSGSDIYHLLGPTYEVFSITNPEAGTWTVQMRGANVSADGEMVRLNTTQSPPVDLPPIASFTTSVDNGTAPLDVAFDASASTDFGGTVTGYSWDFGDGTTGTGVTTSHTFTKPGTYAVHLTVTDDGGLLGFAAATVLVREPTQLSYAGSTSGDFNDPVHLAALLTGSLTGQPIAAASVNLSISGAGGSQGCAATTDTSGVASCDLTLTLPSGSYTVDARLDQTDRLAGAHASAAFTVNAEETTLNYTGPTAVPAGSPAAFSAVLLEDGITPVPGRQVVFTLGTDASAQTCSAVTSASGVASCSITVAQALGPTPLTIVFSGDSLYADAAVGTNVVVFDYATGGAFVVGDKSAGSPSPTIGTGVTFWSARWRSTNTLSGGSTPAQFLGFENSNALPVCGVDWTGDPGNSGSPPPTLPTYMAVIVSSNVSQSGATLTGDTLHVVIVHVAPGYANDPSNPGTGTIVAVLC